MARWKSIALLVTGLAIGVVLTATPAGSHVASWAHNWKQHVRPKADARYLPGENLPRAKMIRGTYIIRESVSSGTGFAAETFSFSHALRSGPTPHMVPVGQTPPAACPGTAANPKAAVGHFCIYEQAGTNISGYGFTNPATGASNTASRWGTTLGVISGGSGVFESMGTWAVRAP